MKIKLVVILMLSVIMVNAQELSKIGQTNLNMFNKSITRLGTLKPGTPTYEMEIKTAERKLDLLKKSDPGYNTSSLESELQSYRDKNSESTDNNQWAKDKTQTTSSSMDLEQFDELLSANTKAYDNIKEESELSKLIAEVNAFETKVSSFASQNGDQSSNFTAKNKAEDGWETYLPDATTIVYAKKNADRVEESLYANALYYKVKLVKCKWDAMYKMFPLSEIIKEAYDKSNEAFSALGSPEELAAKSGKTKADRIATVKIKEPVVSDPAVEAEIKKVLAESKIAAGKKIIKVSIQSSEWSVKRHAISGVILSRTKAFEAVWKEADGTCTLYYYAMIKQDYDGSKYGKSYAYMGQTTQILCENVK